MPDRDDSDSIFRQQRLHELCSRIANQCEFLTDVVGGHAGAPVHVQQERDGGRHHGI